MSTRTKKITTTRTAAAALSVLWRCCFFFVAVVLLRREDGILLLRGCDAFVVVVVQLPASIGSTAAPARATSTHASVVGSACGGCGALLPSSSSSSSQASRLVVLLAAGGVATSTTTARQERSDNNTAAASSSSADGGDQQKNQKKKKKSQMTLQELQEEMLKNPARYNLLQQPGKKKQGRQQPPKGTKNDESGRSGRRTRRRVDDPQQMYAYASQRKQRRQQQQRGGEDEGEGEGEGLVGREKATAATTTAAAAATQGRRQQQQQPDSSSDAVLAKELGLVVAAQHCDPEFPELVVGRPSLVRRIPLDAGAAASDDGGGSPAATSSSGSTTTTSFAYVVEKPAGWAILGSAPGGSKKKKNKNNKKQNRQTTTAAGGTTKEEAVAVEDPQQQQQREVSKNKGGRRRVISIREEDGSVDELEYDEVDVASLLTPEELQEEYGSAAVVVGVAQKTDTTANAASTSGSLAPAPAPASKSAAASSVSSSDSEACFRTSPRPSVVSWLQEVMSEQGTPIRGGNAWKAVAGATDVDDSGLVLLCPRGLDGELTVHAAEYVAVVGTGGAVAKVDSKRAQKGDTGNVHMEILSKLRKGREKDIVHAVRVTVDEDERNGAGQPQSTCSSVVGPCQDFFEQGIRGDPAANPLDRRARRRLIHCDSLTVSSRYTPEVVLSESSGPPDDVRVFANRRHDLQFTRGSFLGRSQLRNSTSTTAYREINGAADNYPGWTVDRYDKWLLVQHDPMHPKGPLPSIHDGYTSGVYLLESVPDRNSMGTNAEARPRLLEGQPVPQDKLFPILENGIKYLVSFEDLSTGVFLDQRPQRGWLARNCGPETRILNCFAHTGAYSVAAASSGASTVSLDLSRKWLDRLPENLAVNGITNADNRHDCIYGDCFDWMAKLAKRGEKYDIVILDPPSSSVGGKKKKRWSIKNDMDELVELAASMVKKNGLLWTTTNSASIPHRQFSRLCQKGLERSTAIESFRLERIQPMPTDFPCIGPQPVKNLIWRLF